VEAYTMHVRIHESGPAVEEAKSRIASLKGLSLEQLEAELGAQGIVPSAQAVEAKPLSAQDYMAQLKAKLAGGGAGTPSPAPGPAAPQALVPPPAFASPPALAPPPSLAPPPALASASSLAPPPSLTPPPALASAPSSAAPAPDAEPPLAPAADPAPMASVVAQAEAAAPAAPQVAPAQAPETQAVYSYYPPYEGAPVAYIDPANGYGVYLVSPLPQPQGPGPRPMAPVSAAPEAQPDMPDPGESQAAGGLFRKAGPLEGPTGASGGGAAGSAPAKPRHGFL
jgi:hypothetical protein